MGLGTKALLRKRMREHRDQIPPHLRAEWSQRIKGWLFDFDLFQRAKRIHLFLSFRSEVQTLLWLPELFALGKRIAVPVMGAQEQRLLLSEIRDSDSPLIPNRFGILEPSREGLRPQPVNSVDLFLLPGFAFDQRGGRLGYGRGYYDRLLAEAPTTIPKIGLAFAFQIVENIPQLPEDIRMDYIVTESGLFTCHTGSSHDRKVD
jgi:5-formyltetrahydrofolate cyclo-ligase